MLPTQRRMAILAEIRERSAVSADDLSRQFAVSLETIRRDLRDLHVDLRELGAAAAIDADDRAALVDDVVDRVDDELQRDVVRAQERLDTREPHEPCSGTITMLAR